MIKFEYIWIATLTIASIKFCLYTDSSLFDSSVIVSGVLCVTLTAAGRIEGYIAGWYASCSYSYIAWQNGLFGEVGLNLLFFLPTGIAGFFMWRRNMKKEHVVIMRQLTWAIRGCYFLGSLLSFIILGFILANIEGQNTPYVDSATNILSIAATFLMMWRYKEQWILYFTLNILSIIMWVLRWQAGGAAGDLMIVMWTIYLLNSIYGYYRWSKGAAEVILQKEEEPCSAAA